MLGANTRQRIEARAQGCGRLCGCFGQLWQLETPAHAAQLAPRIGFQPLTLLCLATKCNQKNEKQNEQRPNLVRYKECSPPESFHESAGQAAPFGRKLKQHPTRNEKWRQGY